MPRPFGPLQAKPEANGMRLRFAERRYSWLDSSRRDSDYGVGPPSVVDPANTCRPSARVTFLPLAIFEPSLAR